MISEVSVQLLNLMLYGHYLYSLLKLLSVGSVVTTMFSIGEKPTQNYSIIKFDLPYLDIM